MSTKKSKSVKHKPKHTKKTSEKKSIKPQKVVPKNKKLLAKSKSSKTTPVKTKKALLSQRDKLILKIKKNLLAQRENLLKEAEEALNALPGEINFPDMGDQATAETDRNFMLRLKDRERLLLKKIDEALERIENNTFGICEGCGNEIGIKRLEARPVTTLCIECKTKQEEEERIAGSG